MSAAAFLTSLQEAVAPREVHHLLFAVTKVEPRYVMNGQSVNQRSETEQAVPCS
jgi:hypothetical protein